MHILRPSTIIDHKLAFKITGYLSILNETAFVNNSIVSFHLDIDLKQVYHKYVQRPVLCNILRQTLKPSDSSSVGFLLNVLI